MWFGVDKYLFVLQYPLSCCTYFVEPSGMPLCVHTYSICVCVGVRERESHRVNPVQLLTVCLSLSLEAKFVKTVQGNTKGINDPPPHSTTVAEDGLREMGQ